MKRKLLFFIAFLPLLFVSCDKQDLEEDLESSGFSLVWGHSVFDEVGRALLFNLSGFGEYRNIYEMRLDVDIIGQEINIRLKDVVFTGTCSDIYFSESICGPVGQFYVSENLLSDGDYTLKFHFNTYIAEVKLVREGDYDYRLIVPDNSKLHSFIDQVYAIPKNILYGGIVYEEGDEDIVENIILELETLGLAPAVIPERPNDSYSRKLMPHLSTTSLNGLQQINLLYEMNIDFATVFEKVEDEFERANGDIGIYLNSSHGDKAYLDRTGVTLQFAPPEGINMFPAP